MTKTIALVLATLVAVPLAVGSVYELTRGFRSGRFAKRFGWGELGDSDYAYRDRDAVAFTTATLPYFLIFLIAVWLISNWFR